MTLTLRIGTNRAIWEDGDVDELLRMAFSKKSGEPDLELSVYQTEQARLTQVRAEHLVSLTNPAIAAATLDLDLSGLAPGRRTPGQTLFHYANDAHEELLFEDREALRRAIAVVRDEGPRRIPRDRHHIMDFIAERAGDEEWTQALAQRPRWREELERHRRRQKPPPPQ
ncbi:MAG: hypothetical protein ACOZQL_28090 [Myxococcota bacterium]